MRDGALEPPGGAEGGCDLRHSGRPCSSPLPRPRTGLSPAAVHAGPGVGGHREGVSPSQPDLRQKRRRRRKTGFPRQGPAPRGGRLRGQAASGTSGFGTGGFGAPGTSPQECSGFVAASLAPIRGQRAAWGPSPSGLRVLACPLKADNVIT